VVLVVSLLVHAALIDALPDLPSWSAAKEEPIVARIEMPPVPPVVITPPTPIPPLPRMHLDQPATKIQPLPTVPVPSETPANTPVISAAEGPNSVAAGNGNAAEALAQPSPSPPADPSPPSALPVAPAPPAARPVDATLTYDVTALDPKNPNQSLIGHGTLGFHASGDSYRATLDARVALLFLSFAVLSSESDGAVGPDGLEPQRYSETPRNKPTSITSFARDANGTSQVSYSQGGDVVTAAPGTQDHLTVLLQIGALMQANANLKAPGTRFTIPVAGLKGKVEPWTFAVQGVEPVKLDRGTQDGLHVMRILRPGTNDRGIEVWVGTESPNIPLRVRYTEPGGATIDLMLASSN